MTLTATLLDRARTIANADGEFRLAARFWDTQLGIASGDSRFMIAMTGGVIADVRPASEPWEPESEIVATPEAWAEMLQPEPRPFYHDLYGARTWHEVQVTGDASLAYYPAARRLIELLRHAANTGSD